MTEDPAPIRDLIERVVKRTRGDVASTGAEAMLSLIPYVGGAVATIVGDFANQRRVEKVCDVLSALNAALLRHGLEAERHLTKDQIVELIYETLQAVSFASDQAKIEALTAALVNAFVSSESFDRKQFFLHLLRETTNVELVMLRVLYDAPDPFVIGRGGPERTGDNASPKHPKIAIGYWYAATTAENKIGQTLLEYLAHCANLDLAIAQASLLRLDGRGLATAGPHLHRRDWKVVTWVPMPEEHIKKLRVASISFEVGKEVRSPLEASRTKLGEEFMKAWDPSV